MINEDDLMALVSDPLIVEIFLFSNNYKDRLLIGELKERANLVRLDEENKNSFFVQVTDLEDILHTSFRKDIAEYATMQRSTNGAVTSIYFINGLLRSFHNLKYVKINVSDSEIYSRKIDDKIIFDYKIIHTKVDLASILNDEDLADVKALLIDAEIYNPKPFEKTPYIEITAKDLIFILSNYIGDSEDEDEDSIRLVNGLKALIGPKIEADNSVLLIVIER